jgi:hypothetical protein
VKHFGYRSVAESDAAAVISARIYTDTAVSEVPHIEALYPGILSASRLWSVATVSTLSDGEERIGKVTQALQGAESECDLE